MLEENKEKEEKLEPLVPQDSKVQLEQLDLGDPQDNLEKRENVEALDHLVDKALLDLEVLLVKLVHVVSPDQMEDPVRLVLEGPLVPEVHKELVVKELLVRLELKVLSDL